MEDKLKRLRKSMENTVMKELIFEKKQMDAIRKSIKNDYRLAILQLLRTEKSGAEVIKGLRARGITAFEDLEGMLFTSLHDLEQQHVLESYWVESEKRYKLARKGHKLLEELEGETRKSLSEKLQELWSGGSNR
ncbi:helix-turn-helix transcriptional regulator [Sutcliffiella rhizosphaerae]|uniref:Transcription regulator PadR N-terminal domain-containing protein n=1 Tax=Sutcliffiella rhizosphaerae TaxID=2880967 RepID=A0ABN8ADZ4_9BACI|nr:helix-turn-helix transcriptional regulator [Sutcliffiella rhizosphaerae]CAG9621323.1 hypothetical protein BACCIP111883_02095 [Sutcliffiella rhizosphaerae]